MTTQPERPVAKQGYLRKLKTMKKKYFVLRSEAPECSARLEYYDSEKKFRQRAAPKKVIPLKSCFNITRRLDTRCKHVIALYTKEECLCVVAEDEEELAGWLAALQEPPGDDTPHPRQHVWQVNVQKKGLGASHSILGLYNLCLTDKTLSLVKIRPNSVVIPHDRRAADTYEFSLINIRRCGDSECFFYMEVGRSSVTGAGELWMHTEDPNIAKSMHATILGAMSSSGSNGSNGKEDSGTHYRVRSASATSANKPVSVLARRQTEAQGMHNNVGSAASTVRSRCDSLPGASGGSASATTASPTLPVAVATSPLPSVAAQRPQSMYVRAISSSPPTTPHTDVLSLDEPDFHPTPHLLEDMHMLGRLMSAGSGGVIPEEVAEELGAGLALGRAPSSPVDIAGGDAGNNAYMQMSPGSLDTTTPMHHRPGIGSTNHSRTSSMAEEASHAAANSTDDGYVDMEPSKDAPHPRALSPADSTCSIMSATPSNDMRFSEFHLEKVASYFTPSEEDEENRPARAYSVGSRPENARKVINKPEACTNSSGDSRMRAFSVGSKVKSYKDARILSHGTPPAAQLHHALHHQFNLNAQKSKACSAPAIPGHSRFTYSSSHSSAEPLDDLMEMDFSQSSASRRALAHSCSESARLSSNPTVSPLPTPAAEQVEGYMEMKPSDNLPDLVKKVYIAKSPPSSIRSEVSETLSTPQPTVPEGYVEMSWNNKSAVKPHSRSRISSLPITINTSGPKDLKGFHQSGPSSASPSARFNLAAILKESDSYESGRKATPPKISPGLSPVTPATPGTPVSPLSSLRRKSKKHQVRRNSKENPVPLPSQTIFPFSLNSPGSPMKPFGAENSPGRKCPVDPSSGTLKLTEAPLAETEDCIPIAECPSDYMEMTPGRLSTVREMTEPASNRSVVDKDIKQLINNATKVASQNVALDLAEYISLDAKATSDRSKTRLATQKSFDAVTRLIKPTNGGQQGLQITKKISVPAFSGAAYNSKDNHSILSSNPLANKTMLSDSIGKVSPMDNNKRKPIVVLSQTQSITANFKPISSSECENKSKGGSPKPGESALKRYLADNRSGSGESSISARSRPGSASSELGMEPPRALHYASLELDTPAERSPRPAPTTECAPAAFTYAQIDFVKSEELKNSKNLVAKSKNS